VWCKTGFSNSEFPTRVPINWIAQLIFLRQSSDVSRNLPKTIGHHLSFTNSFLTPLENWLKRIRKRSFLHWFFIQNFQPQSYVCD
jgi:hypothetical protein